MNPKNKESIKKVEKTLKKKKRKKLGRPRKPKLANQYRNKDGVISPTPKQKALAKAVRENYNNQPISKLAKDVGYSAHTASQTNTLTNAQGFQYLLNQNLPNEELTKTHKQGLQATTRFYYRDKSGLHWKLTPDYSTRHRYLETGYKLKGLLRDNQPSNQLTINQINISDKEFQAILSRLNPKSK